MTNKTQTMLTIALTAAVSLLLVDRIIEPAQAQDCAPMWQVSGVSDSVHSTHMLVSDLSTELVIMDMKMDSINIKLETLMMMVE